MCHLCHNKKMHYFHFSYFFLFYKGRLLIRKQCKNVQSFPSHSVISLWVGCFQHAGFVRVLSFLQALFKPNNFRITHGTFKSMSKVLCNQEITPLFFESLLPDFGDPVSNSSHAEDVYVQKLMRKYGIPQDSSKSGFSLGHKRFKAELCYFQTDLCWAILHMSLRAVSAHYLW